MAIRIEHPTFYLTEGSNGSPSTHKAESAGHILGVPIGIIGVSAREPNEISYPLGLIEKKWGSFTPECLSSFSFSEPVILMVLDVVTRRGTLGGRMHDVRKLDIKPEGDNTAEKLAKRVANDMQFAGKNHHVVLTLEPAAEAGLYDPINESWAIVSAVGGLSVFLPNNPLLDSKLFYDYVQWSGLEVKLCNAIPGGYDLSTLLAFLALNDKLSGRKIKDLVVLPTVDDYEHLSSRDIDNAIEFFYKMGRVTEEMLRVLPPVVAVALLQHAFNTPRYLLERVIGEIYEVEPKKTLVSAYGVDLRPSGM